MSSSVQVDHNPYVLLVEDDQGTRQLYVTYLTRRGYSVLEASRAQEALDIIDEKMPGVILLDIMMPGMSGLEALEIIRKKYASAELPVILLTALGSNSDVMRGLELGATDYLIKPIELSELAARVRMHLSTRELLDEKSDNMERLQELDLIKDKFIQITAHDLKSPLTTIDMGLQIMSESLPQLTNVLPEFARIHEMMTASSEMMQSIISDYLDLQMIQAGRLDLELQHVSLNTSIESVLRQLRGYAEGKKIRIKTDLDPKLPTLKADLNRLKQIVNNLVNNAVKYSPSDTTVLVRTSTANGAVRMEVTDSGPGILPEEIPLLFQEFSRLSNRPTGGEKSSGVGLTITRYLVEAHKGQILVETTPGKGSTFIIEIPT